MDKFKNSKGLILGGKIETSGKDNALFMLHGFGGSYIEALEIFNWISDFSKDKNDVYRFSYSGNPGSEGKFVDFTMEDFINDSIDLIKANHHKYKTISILGFSMGSLIASHLSYLLPQEILSKMKKIILLSPIISMSNGAFNKFKEQLGSKNDFGDIKEAKFTETEMISKYFVINSMKWPASQKIKSFNGEVLILQAETDLSWWQASRSFYIDNYKNVTYLMCKGADHCWTKKQDRIFLEKKLKIFLNK